MRDRIEMLRQLAARADHFIAFDLAFCQGPAAMRTGILNRVVSATHIENGDLLPTYLDELSPF